MFSRVISVGQQAGIPCRLKDNHVSISSNDKLKKQYKLERYTKSKEYYSEGACSMGIEQAKKWLTFLKGQERYRVVN